MQVSIDWEANPINVWHIDKTILDELLKHLHFHGLLKHSIVMPDRDRGGFLFFVYETVDPNLILEWEERR